MAGVSVGDESDNPVGINVTPLVDIIFCLCVFFMISFRFKQIEGRFVAWLPRNTGPGPGDLVVPLTEVRVALFWNETTRDTVRQLGHRRVADDEELAVLLREAHDDCVRLDQPISPVTIDADVRVPWRDVVGVVNVCKQSGLDKVAFALQAPTAERR